MKKHKIIWYISKDYYLEGEEAVLYLEAKMNSFHRLLSTMTTTLSSITNKSDFTRTGHLIDDVCNAGDILSTIQVQLEMLIDDMNEVLE